MADEKKKGFLSSIFNFETITKAILITIPLVIVGNIFWQLALDPTFFPWIHDNSDVMSQALIAKMEPVRHAALWTFGLEGDGPLSGIMQAWLQPEMDQIIAERNFTPDQTENLGNMLMEGLEPTV